MSASTSTSARGVDAGKEKTPRGWHILKGLTKKKAGSAATTMTTTTTTADGRQMGGPAVYPNVIVPPSGTLLSEAVVMNGYGVGIEMEDSFDNNGASPGSMTMTTTSLDPNANHSGTMPPSFDLGDFIVPSKQIMPERRQRPDGHNTEKDPRRRSVKIERSESTKEESMKVPRKRSLNIERSESTKEETEKVPRRRSVKIERSESTKEESDKERRRSRRAGARQRELGSRPDNHGVSSSISSAETFDHRGCSGGRVSLGSAIGVVASTANACVGRVNVVEHSSDNDFTTSSDLSAKRGISLGSPTGVENLWDGLMDSSVESSSVLESPKAEDSLIIDEEIKDPGCCALFGGGGFYSVLDVVDRIDDAINGRIEDDDEYSYDESYTNSYEESSRGYRLRKVSDLIARQKNSLQYGRIEGKNGKATIDHHQSRERQRRQKHRTERSRRSRRLPLSSSSGRDKEVVGPPRTYQVSFSPSTIPSEGDHVLEYPKGS